MFRPFDGNAVSLSVLESISEMELWVDMAPTQYVVRTGQGVSLVWEIAHVRHRDRCGEVAERWVCEFILSYLAPTLIQHPSMHSGHGPLLRWISHRSGGVHCTLGAPELSDPEVAVQREEEERGAGFAHLSSRGSWHWRAAVRVFLRRAVKPVSLMISLQRGFTTQVQHVHKVPSVVRKHGHAMTNMSKHANALVNTHTHT